MAVLVAVGTVNVVAVNTQQHTNHTMFKDIIGGITNLFTKEEPIVSNQIGVDDSFAIDLVEQWGNNYHGSASEKKRKRAYEVVSSDFTVPDEALNSIAKASYIFDGDNNFSGEQLSSLLKNIGAIESNYTTKVQKGKGPARSYWQVEPSTAKSLLNNSSKLFGPKFNKEFAQYAEGDTTASQVLADKSLKELSALLEADSNLGAAMATAKIVTTF
jgi:hypothetical protein